ncbi:MAG: hypothetical protein NTY07_19660, partial [Bacteroidia bacterium]|nr:hypothetical protein [Bacteroidia bacterium]
SPSNGLGFIRYDFKVDITSTAPNAWNPELHAVAFAPKVLSGFYPVIIDIIGKLSLPIPNVEGLSVAAVRIWPGSNNNEPTTFSIGFGGKNTDKNKLLGILDHGDDLMVTIGKRLFDQRCEKFNNDSFPSSSYNKDEKRSETVKSVKISLGNDQLYLNAKIGIQDYDAGFLEPSSSEITVNGPLLITLTAEGLDTKIAADGSQLDVDIDSDWLFDLTRVFIDIITIGLAEIKISPAIDDAEDKVRNSTADQIANGFKDALFGAYPSGMELIGRNIYYTRESFVLWSAPSFINIKEDMMMLGGAARAGIKHAPRKDLAINSTYRPHKNIKAYGILGKKEPDEKLAFFLDRDKATKQWVDNKFTVDGLELIKMKTEIINNGEEQKQITLYLRDHYNKKEEGTGDDTKSDNLLNQNYFNPASADLANANDWEPLTTNKRYGFNDSNEFVEL